MFFMLQKNLVWHMKKLIAALLFAVPFILQAQEHYLLAGTYTSGKSEGIYVLKFNSVTGEATKVSTAKSSNPSYLAVSPNQKMVYAVNENKTDNISAFSFNKATGALKEINQQPASGDHPCYVSVHKSGKWVVAGNYSSGNLVVFPVNKNGSIGKAVQTVQHEGVGSNTQRQESAHVHATVFSPDGKYLFVPDLGIDKIMIYRFNQQTGRLSAHDQPFEKSKPGAGPRHMEFHPNSRFAYLMEELSGSIKVMKYDGNGHLSQLQLINGHDTTYTGKYGSADIHVSGDGNFLYCSNRENSNTIGIFKVNQQTGLLTLVGHQSTMGNTPRNFNFDPTGNYLLVANQNSDAIVVFKVNKETGLLSDTGSRINIPNPVCIKWAVIK
jgi:6-phosphogluconolactonase